LIREVIESVTVIEREVRDHQGRWYSLRIRPYKNVDNRIDGAVMALFDIHPSDAALGYAKEVLDIVRQPLVLLDGHLRVQRVNKAFAEAFQMPSAEIAGEPLYKIGDGQWDIATLRSTLADLLAGKQPVEECQLEHEFPGIGWRKVRITARQLGRPEDRQPLVLMAMEDITEDSKLPGSHY
jgi:two-component system CheB/CheR fusion protein